MKDPRRWLDEPDQLSAEERAILARGVTPEPPPPDARQRVWAATLATLEQGGAGEVGDAPSQAPAPPAAVALDVRVWASALLVGALAAAGLVISSSGESATVTSFEAQIPSVAIPPQEPATAGGEPAPQPPSAPNLPTPPEAPPVPDVSTSSSHHPELAASARTSRLLEESLWLRRARALLRRGNAEGTLALVDEGDRRFAGGQLAQERQALRVEALIRIDRDRAAQEAKAFEERYPSSPHKSLNAAKPDAESNQP